MVKKIYIKLLLTITLIALFSGRIVASPQLPDYIVYKNDTIPIYNLILEDYLQKKNPDEISLFGFSMRNSKEASRYRLSCWRGYQAIYKIENDSLFLSDIIACGTLKNINKKQSGENINLIFGDKGTNGKIFIDWFNGELNFPTKPESNKIIRWDGFFEIIYLYETLITVKKGKVEKVLDIENYIDMPDKINRMKRDTIQSIIFEGIKEYNWKKRDKFDCSETYIIRINKKGKIDRVKMDLSRKEIRGTFFMNEYYYCMRTMRKIIKKLDLEFDVIKRKGKAIEEDIYLDIWFDDDGTINIWIP